MHPFCCFVETDNFKFNPCAHATALKSLVTDPAFVLKKGVPNRKVTAGALDGQQPVHGVVFNFPASAMEAARVKCEKVMGRIAL